MYSAAAVANVFLDLAGKDNSLTHMKVQKLVYISHGWSLVLLDDHGLVYDEIKAWPYGPVIPDLYDSLKHYGGRRIDSHVPMLPVQAVVEPGSKEFGMIRNVWESYGKFSAYVLSSITHQPDTPWRKTWDDNPYGPITNDVIKEHYLKLNERRRSRQQQPAS